MDTFKIRAVLAAMKHKSLSRDAQEFNYTPSAFSHILSSFENELGVKLFQRSYSGVFLTPEGEKLKGRLLEMLACEERLVSEARALSAERPLSLRVATYPSISRNLLSEIFREFRVKHPEIRLSVSVVDSLVGWLENDKADIIFGDAYAFQKNEWQLLLEDEYFAVVPEGLLPGKHSVTREELYACPHILTDDAPLRQYFEKERFRERIDFRSEDDLSIINMVRSGVGVAVLPGLVLRGNSRDVRVIRLTPTLSRSLGFAYRRGGPKDPALSCFVRFLENEKDSILRNL